MKKWSSEMKQMHGLLYWFIALYYIDYLHNNERKQNKRIWLEFHEFQKIEQNQQLKKNPEESKL